VVCQSEEQILQVVEALLALPPSQGREADDQSPEAVFPKLGGRYFYSSLEKLGHVFSLLVK
jgi:hypothetical protein